MQQSWNHFARLHLLLQSTALILYLSLSLGPTALRAQAIFVSVIPRCLWSCEGLRVSCASGVEVDREAVDLLRRLNFGWHLKKSVHTGMDVWDLGVGDWGVITTFIWLA